MLIQKDRENYFGIRNKDKKLGERSVRGGLWMMSAEGVKFIVKISSTIVLARLLSPKDFGLVAMVAVVMNFAMMFRHMGLSVATIQKHKITEELISTIFWVNTAAGLFISLIICAIAPAIALFYKEQKLFFITIAIHSMPL